MKFKKFVLIFIISLFIFTVKSDATTIDIDVTKIADNFNNSIYVSRLAEFNEFVSAKQNGNDITLSYGNDNLVFVFENGVFSVTYPFSDRTVRKKCDILSAIFIDTVATMQGKEPGELIAFALDDSFCFTTLSDNGIAKDYLTDVNSNMVVNFSINPYFKLPSVNSDKAISEDSFLTKYDTFYPDVDCVVKQEDLIFYKTFSDNGDMELYIGRSDEVDDITYDSVLTAVDLLFKDKRASRYFRQNYSNFSVGNAEFDGVSVNIDIDKLPVSNVDTSLLPLNMKFVKFTVNRDVVKENLKSISLSSPDVGDSTSNSESIPLPLIICLSIMGFLACCLVVFVFRKIILKK